MQETFGLETGEVLAQVLDCAVKSVTFFHPGQLFITTERICFKGSVSFLQAEFDLPWSSVSWVRAVTREMSREDDEPPQGRTGSTASSDHGYTVRLVLTKAMAFDGVQVESLELDMFESGDVATLHRCTEVFTGQGVFERITLPLRASSGVPGAKEILEIRDHVEHESMNICELERRRNVLGEDWQAPFLPIDQAIAPSKWTHLDSERRVYTTHPALPPNLTNTADSEGPPISTLVALGRRRTCKWSIVVDDDTDSDGWQYGLWRFSTDPSIWQKDRGVMSQVRRRRWKPEFAVDDESKSMPAISRSVSSLMSERKLSKQALIQQDMGNLPLATLGAWLEADDWLVPGSFMAEYFSDQEQKDIEVDQWADNNKVEGKLRSVRMRAPVPPQPMCPKETRANQTWHVTVEADRVLVETSTMSLDVPYGTSFMVVICHTFTINPETQTTAMVSTYALDWVQSTWLKSTIEASVPKELLKASKKLGAFISRYNQQKLREEDFGPSAGVNAIPVHLVEEQGQVSTIDYEIGEETVHKFQSCPFLMNCCKPKTTPSLRDL